jgi:hypothetical protein
MRPATAVISAIESFWSLRAAGSAAHAVAWMKAVGARARGLA